MNLGWYEIMDRISVIQIQLEDSVREHQVSDMELIKFIDKAQDYLSDAYQYSAEKFNSSFEEDLNV